MSCIHTETTVVSTPNSVHHGKEICLLCGKFMRWMPKPEAAAKQAENGNKIVQLRSMDLGAWANAFIQSLDGKGPKISPKQQAKLDELWMKHGATR